MPQILFPSSQWFRPCRSSDTTSRIQLQNYGSVSRRPIIHGSTGSWFHNNAANYFSPALSDPANGEDRIQLHNYESVSRRPIINGEANYSWIHRSWCTTMPQIIFSDPANAEVPCGAHYLRPGSLRRLQAGLRGILVLVWKGMKYWIKISVLRIQIRIRLLRIRLFLGLLDPDPLVRGMDPDPDSSIIKQK